MVPHGFRSIGYLTHCIVLDVGNCAAKDGSESIAWKCEDGVSIGFGSESV